LKLKPEVKAQWLAALRSGDYEQGHGIMRTLDNKFCCLGVLCDVLAPEEWHGTSMLGQYHGNDSLIFPSNIVTATAFDVDTNSAGDRALALGLYRDLSERNDNGDSFDAIAEYIETNVQ